MSSVPDRVDLGVDGLTEARRLREERYAVKDESGLSLSDILTECAKSRDNKYKPVIFKSEDRVWQSPSKRKAKVITVKCVTCGVEIIKTTKERRRFCPECAKKSRKAGIKRYSRQKHLKLLHDNPTLYFKIVCPYCGKKFNRQHVRKIYCSTKCQINDTVIKRSISRPPKSK